MKNLYKYPRAAYPYEELIRGNVLIINGHGADNQKASMLDSAWPGCVDLSHLPTTGKLKTWIFLIVDGETFYFSPTPDHTLREDQRS